MWIFEAPLPTERLILRPYRESDLGDLYAIQSEPETVRYTPFEVKSRAEVAESIARYVRSNRLADHERGGLMIAVERRSDERLIGSLTFWRDPQHHQGEIGYIFNRDAHGHGYASEAVTAALDLAFGPLGVHRVYARIDARNGPSVALATRVGMRQEGHLRENEWFKGEWSDELIFAILASERSPARPVSRGSR